MQKTARPPSNPYTNMAREAARNYRRPRHLPALLALWPSQLEDLSPSGTRRIIKHLEAVLQGERRRGRARHWAYDLNRHLALLSALEGERRHLASLGKSGGRDP